MKKGVFLSLAVLLIALVVALLRFGNTPPPGSVGEDSVPGIEQRDSAERADPERSIAPVPEGPGENTVGARKPYDTGIPNDPRVRHTPDGRHVFVEAMGMAASLHDPEGSPEEDLHHLNSILGFYRTIFGENPVAGDNQSVMAALMGANTKRIVLFPADHPALNEDGELLDRWKSPYYFHALSGRLMEIVSLGPDRKLGSDDDLIFTPRDDQSFFRGVTEKPDFAVDEEE